MSILQANGAGLGGAGDPGGALASSSIYGTTIDQSLRFNDNDLPNLNRTPSTAGDRQVWTWSAWVKRSNLSTTQYLFVGGSNADNATYVRFVSNDKFQIFHYDSNSATNNVQTEQVFRDVSSWYHIVLAVDTTQATASDRVKIYVNGERVTNFTTATYPSLNFNYDINTTGSHRIGSNYAGSGTSFDGYMAEVNFIDGTQLNATSFGETINGVWVPKAYDTADGAYGTNGFYLPFDDSSAIGDDESGNTNDFTANNLADSDVVPDSPTLNYPTWNPLVNTGQTLTFAEGNLNLDASSTFWSSGTWNQSTMGVLGGSDAKYYFEFTMNGNTSGSYVIGVGRQNSSAIDTTHYTGGVVYYYNRCSSDSTNTVTGLTIASSLTIIRLAFDASNGKVWIGDDNGYFNSGDPAAGTGEVGTISGYDGEMLVAILNRSTNAGDQVVNFGQDDTFAGFKTSGSASATDDNGYGTFYYTPPTGFLALNSASLPEPTIGPNAAEQADNYFDTVTWSGDGTSSRGITGVGHAPDFVWIKTRNQNNEHSLFDSVRGVAKDLESNSTAVEQANNVNGYLNSFDSDGFTVVDGSSGSALVNASGNTFVAWNWKAGGTAVLNEDGTIDSQVSAAPDAGFSIVTWDALGFSTGTVGHGLTVAPDIIIAKAIDHDTNWFVQVPDVLANTHILNLETTAAAFNPGINHFNDTVPTDSVFSIGGYLGNHSDIGNTNTDKIAYCFHSVEGYSKVGSYVGNGSTDGTFVYTGFEVSFLLTKESSSTSGWNLRDSVRSPENVVNEVLQADTNGAEMTSNYDVDFLSNGFKLRTSLSDSNTNGQTYIYLAFAEAPFKYANAR